MNLLALSCYVNQNVMSLILLDNHYSIHKVARLASLDKIFEETTTQKEKMIYGDSPQSEFKSIT